MRRPRSRPKRPSLAASQKPTRARRSGCRCLESGGVESCGGINEPRDAEVSTKYAAVVVISTSRDVVRRRCVAVTDGQCTQAIIHNGPQVPAYALLLTHAVFMLIVKRLAPGHLGFAPRN